MASNLKIRILRKVLNFIENHLFNKWDYVYFKYNLINHIYLNNNYLKDFNFRLAIKSDLSIIKNDIYPILTKTQINDLNDFLNIGNKDFDCVLCFHENKIIHYLFIFKNIYKSPLVKTPLKRHHFSKNDIYIGSAFTNPIYRGHWIMPASLNFALNFYSKNNYSNAILLVYKKTPGATGFFKRFGFQQIENATRKPYYLNYFKNE
jgi:GNAT superfamily N-acetyltransferase